MNRFDNYGLKIRSLNRFSEGGAYEDEFGPTLSQAPYVVNDPEAYNNYGTDVTYTPDKQYLANLKNKIKTDKTFANITSGNHAKPIIDKYKAEFDHPKAAEAGAASSVGMFAGAIETMIKGSLSGVSQMWSLLSKLGANTFGALGKMIMGWAKGAHDNSVTSFLGTAISKITEAISGAITTASSWISKIYNSAGMNSSATQIGLPNVSWGQVIGFALLAAAVLFVLYKIYKAVKNRTTESVINNRNQLIGIKRGIYESTRLFKDLNPLTEGTGAATVASEGILSKAGDMALEMWDWIKSKLDAGYTTVSEFVHNNPYISLMIVVCIGIIIAYVYFGMDSPANPVTTTAGSSTDTKTVATTKTDTPAATTTAAKVNTPVATTTNKTTPSAIVVDPGNPTKEISDTQTWSE